MHRTNESLLLEANDDQFIVPIPATACTRIRNYGKSFRIPSPRQVLPLNRPTSPDPSHTCVGHVDSAMVGAFEATGPQVLISLFLASSAVYCFVIGRNRYTSVSEFVIQQAAPLNTRRSVLVELLLLTSSDFMLMASIFKFIWHLLTLKSIISKPKTLEQEYQKKLPDFFTGLFQQLPSYSVGFLSVQPGSLLSH